MGVEKTIINQGDGTNFPQKGARITVHYDGWTAENYNKSPKGPKFDSSRDRNDTFKANIGVGRLIRGWDDAILGVSDGQPMSKGEKAKLVVSPDYGYGAQGFPPVIPPNATLIFEMELLEIA